MLRVLRGIQVFAEVADLVQSSLDGFHVCLMSYGQTGAPRRAMRAGRSSVPWTGVALGASAEKSGGSAASRQRHAAHLCCSGSGKTHTMLGGAQDESRGIVPRALDKVLLSFVAGASVRAGATLRRVPEMSAAWLFAPTMPLQIMGQVQRLALQGWAHTVEACCVELHTQHIRDLLPGGGDGGGAISDMNAIKHDPQGPPRRRFLFE